MGKPLRIGITLGDVNGIGPEVALRSVFKEKWAKDIQFVFVGSAPVLAKQARKFKAPKITPWNATKDPAPSGRALVWDPFPGELKWKPGEITVEASQAAAIWIRMAVFGALNGQLDAMVTAPICKEGMQKAGVPIPGHTEFIAELTNTRRYAMMLTGGKLRVVLVTRHVPLYRVPHLITHESVEETIELTHEALPWLGVKKGRIAVCGLNPHAGENGTLGREENQVIKPSVDHMRRQKINVTGPHSGDTIFHFAARGDYDAVIAMYHDQGLAPLKLAGFDEGVNITLGLPIVRTSPDHGTAFDIAGKGKADSGSMTAAIRQAIALARQPNPWRGSKN